MTLLCNQAKEVMHTDLQGVQNCEKPCEDQCVLVYRKQSKYPCASGPSIGSKMTVAFSSDLAIGWDNGKLLYRTIPRYNLHNHSYVAFIHLEICPVNFAHLLLHTKHVYLTSRGSR